MRVGIEVGGTFTDLVAITKNGVQVLKIPSTPTSPERGVLAALDASEIDVAAVRELAHGSTVATNAVLERKGACIAFITTGGFRDVLYLQRQTRTNIYDLKYAKPQPLVRRRDCYEVPERVLADGSVERALDFSEIQSDLLPALERGGYDAVSICLLNAYANPVNEIALRDYLAERLEGVQIAISSDLTREFREYERASTTSMSAYVQPILDKYIGAFVDELSNRNFEGHLSIMQSNGGRLPAEVIRKRAVTALLSGPAAGVVGAARQVQRSGFANLITLDMGGTSTDVCLVENGSPELTTEFMIDNLPVRTPVLDINTVGAGGGSLVWIDGGGMLRVGPQSAGAYPGPVCYDRGGELPTVTDAHVICGTIRPEAFLGGRMQVRPDLAEKAFVPIARKLGMDVTEAASSAIRLANANIVRAVQRITTQKGKDPRDYALVAFGGAGPLHAARVADELNIRSIVVPPNPGVMSAFGLLASDYIHFESMTQKCRIDKAAQQQIRDIFLTLRKKAQAVFQAYSLHSSLAFTLIIDMRLVGQAFEVQVEVSETQIDALDLDDLIEAFIDSYEMIYFQRVSKYSQIEAVNFRLGTTAPLAEIPTMSVPVGEAQPPFAISVVDERQRLSCTTIARADVEMDDPVPGPVILEDPTSTIYVPQEWIASSDQNQNLVLRREHV